MSTGALEIDKVVERERFEAYLGGHRVGLLTYQAITDDVVRLPHTEVDPAYEGRGIGSALAKAALDDARAEGQSVIASCPFVAAWIGRHPEYADLVADR